MLFAFSLSQCDIDEEGQVQYDDWAAWYIGSNNVLRTCVLGLVCCISHSIHYGRNASCQTPNMPREISVHSIDRSPSIRQNTQLTHPHCAGVEGAVDMLDYAEASLGNTDVSCGSVGRLSQALQATMRPSYLTRVSGYDRIRRSSLSTCATDTNWEYQLASASSALSLFWEKGCLIG